MQNLGMGGPMGQNLERQGNQPVVMVVPQAQAASGGIMGMNPFNMMQQRQAAQMILGNLPAFSSDAFGQQLLTAATNAQLGQMMGVGAQGRRGNQFNPQAFDRDGSDRSRISRRSQATPSGRRPGGNDSRSNLVPRNLRGSNTSASSLNQRGRKRGYPDRQNDVDRKRSRQNHSGRTGNKDKGGKSSNGKSQGNKKKTETTNAKAPATDSPVKDSEIKSEAIEEGQVKVEEVAVVDGEEQKTEAKEKEEGSPKKATDDEKEQKRKSKYDEIPVELLVCKICQKTMNDSSSFESHLSGRAHQSLARILDLRFQKRVDVLMADSKLNEEEISIEMERLKRAGKQIHGGNKNKNFCKMCDCNYAVNWGTHKLSLGHRVLKEFLHPSCRVCDVNFVQRMDWVKHHTDAGHMKKLLKLKEEEGRDLDEDCSPKQDQLFSITLDMSKEDHVPNCISIKNANWKIPSKDDLKLILDSDMKDLVGEDEEIVIPTSHDKAVPYGTNAINEVNGFSCKVCRSYIATQKEVEAHCLSQAHFGAYTGYLRKLAKHREHVKEEARQAAAAAEKAEQERIEKEKEELAKAKEKEEADNAKVNGLEMDENTSAEENKGMEVEESTEAQGNNAVDQNEEEIKGDVVNGDGSSEDVQPVENSPKKPAASDTEVIEESPQKKDEPTKEVEKPQVPVTPVAAKPAVAATPQTATRGGNSQRARFSGARGGPGQGRGQNNNSNQGGRGRARGGSPRGNPGAGVGRGRGGGGGGYDRARGRGRGMR
jgi:hypothetical protein